MSVEWNCGRGRKACGAKRARWRRIDTGMAEAGRSEWTYRPLTLTHSDPIIRTGLYLNVSYPDTGSALLHSMQLRPKQAYFNADNLKNKSE